MVVVVYVVVTTVVRVAGANENWPMVACESRDFGRPWALWPWLLEDMLVASVLFVCKEKSSMASRLLACRPV